MSNHVCPNEPYQLESLCEGCLEEATKTRSFLIDEESGAIIIHGDGHAEFLLPARQNEKVAAAMRELYKALLLLDNQ